MGVLRLGYWVFMLVMVLIVPITMIVFGRLFSNKAPKDIKHTFGYRTKRSMMNKDTWSFAYAYIGKLWLICGLVLMPISIVIMVFVLGKGTDTVGMVGAILTVVQMVLMIGTIIPTEYSLNKNFDKLGRRR